jgi:cytochrome c biogenesis protein
MTKSDPQKKTNIVWNILCSVKLTIVLLIILAIISIFGTVVPQQENAIEFAQKLSPGLVKMLASLQVFDMYHSIWFRIIICALALNLIVCSINRFPATLKLFRSMPRPDREKPFENLPPQRSILVNAELHEAADRVAEILKRSYRNVNRRNTGRGDFFYGEKGRYSHFGVYLVHLSVLLILIGAVMGSVLGFDAYANIAEGGSVDQVALRKSRNPKKLGFNVHCEKFIVEFYDSGAPKEYRSDLVFRSGGKVLRKGSLFVNHPITFRGITFYQSSYGTLPGDRVRLTFIQEGEDPRNSTLEMELKKTVRLPGNDGQFLVADIRDDFMRMGPAVLIVVKPPEGDEIRFWLFRHQEMIKERFPGIFEKFPKLNPSSYRPYTFFLDEIESIYYTGLQVNKDPGVPLVWAGFFMIVAGLFVTFFTSHRRIWVRVSKPREKVNISVAGSASKNPVGLERELDQLAKRFQTKL